MEDSNQISSLPKVEDTSKMQSNSSSTDHIQKQNAHSSVSKRNSWGRTSVSLIVIHIILCIRISVILQFG